MSELDLPEIKLDNDNLYREESFTDRKVGILRRLSPITTDGSDDNSRPTLWIGQTQVMTQAGPLPISFEIEAATLEEALGKFTEGAKTGIQETIEEMQEQRRESASQIVVPGAGGGNRIQVP
ncbi:hypothetical protein BOW53_07695 [Solemya pervernicosa gill symbiont]|uniref:Cytoplasmic protein n=3 Tax=Gammaproteobacteria incertae sedis TaxID=118884 RepID=A0A1T2L5S0_9GAMM|nr:hypothetical protein BOW53_07695 [Solemya pervernicosa gill symbiont]QKQ28129.1 hypothetical protein HUE57_02955 [Candidatus Reidiella endopervernicosa]